MSSLLEVTKEKKIQTLSNTTFFKNTLQHTDTFSLFYLLYLVGVSEAVTLRATKS